MYSTLRVKESKFHHIFVSISLMETQMKTFPYCFFNLNNTSITYFNAKSGIFFIKITSSHMDCIIFQYHPFYSLTGASRFKQTPQIFKEKEDNFYITWFQQTLGILKDQTEAN